MGYTNKHWHDRHFDRIDISAFLTHLTREAEVDGEQLSAVQVLVKILKEKRIRGSSTESGFIVGTTRAVCFQDAPLLGLSQNVRYERELSERGGKVRYRGVGIVFLKPTIYRKGGRPVLYEATDVAKKFLPADQFWRIVNFDLSHSEGYIDWSHEREWRVPGDFAFEVSEIAIVVGDSTQYREFIELAGPELLRELQGVTVLGHSGA